MPISPVDAAPATLGSRASEGPDEPEVMTITAEAQQVLAAKSAKAETKPAADVKPETKPETKEPAEAKEKVETKPETVAKPEAPKPDPAVLAEQEKRLKDRATELRVQLHEREKRVVAGERALAETKKQLEAREAELKAKGDNPNRELEEIKAAKTAAKTDPLGLLEAHGLTFEDVARAAAANQAGDPATRELARKNAALEKRLNERDAAEKAAKEKQETEAKQKSIQDAGEALLTRMEELFKADPDKYGCVAAKGRAATLEVYRSGAIFLQEHGRDPTDAEVLKMAEWWEEQYADEADKLQEKPSVRRKRDAREAAKKAEEAKVAAAAPKPAPVVEEEKDEPERGGLRVARAPRTITNDGPRLPAEKRSVGGLRMTREEEVAEAMRKIRSQTGASGG